MPFVVSSPGGYELPTEDMDRIMTQVPEMDFERVIDPKEAVRNADVIVTDTWVSMGQEAEKARRMADFAHHRVDAELLAAAPGPRGGAALPAGLPRAGDQRGGVRRAAVARVPGRPRTGCTSRRGCWPC